MQQVTKLDIFRTLISLFCILLYFSISITGSFVLDSDGNEVQSNTKYYILPLGKGNDGGLALSKKDRQCPFYVMQENHEASNGLPLKFFPLDNKQQVINLSIDLNIVFTAATICVQSTAWRLGDADEITGHRYVSSGGSVGNPGVHTVNNWFRIEKSGMGDGYKIVWCPSVCSSCKVVCGNVGVFVENDRKWLGLSDVPLLVVFNKV